MRVFVAIKPYEANDKLLRPLTDEAPMCLINHTLKRFGKVYTPDYVSPAVNLIRKWYHTHPFSGTSEAMAVLARFDGHSAAVAKAVYNASSPEEDSANSKRFVEAVLNGTVDWPHAEELAKVNIDDSIRRFARKSKKGCGGDSAESSDSEGDTDDEEEEAEDTKDEQPPAAKPHCRYEFDAKAGKFKTADLNLTVHPPHKKHKQATGASPPKRHFLTDAEKQFLLSQSPKTSFGCTLCPDKQAVQAIVEGGISENKLNATVTYEGARSFLRKAQQEEQDRHDQKQKAANKKGQAKKADKTSKQDCKDNDETQRKEKKSKKDKNKKEKKGHKEKKYKKERKEKTEHKKAQDSASKCKYSGDLN